MAAEPIPITPVAGDADQSLAGTEANIHQRMLAVQRAIGYIPKLGTGPDTQGSYKFARVEHIKDAVRDQHVRHGVMMHTDVQSTDLTTIAGERGTSFLAHVRGRLVFVNVDRPDDMVESPWEGMAVDRSDKAIAKAVTSGVKQALLNAYSIPTGEDPDETAGMLGDGPAGRPHGPRPQRASQAAQRPQAGPQPPGDDVPWPGEGAAPADEGKCPIHGKPWRSGTRGWYCTGKMDDGSWCSQRPSKAWIAAQER